MNNRFNLTKLDGGRYVVSDTETGYSIIFKTGQYNTSQKVIAPEQQHDSPQEAARLGAYAMRSIGDYMAQEHADLVFPSEEQERRRRHFIDTTKDIGQSLRELREYNGYTIEDAADKSGFSVRRIEAIESGKFPADLNVITRIIERLGGRLAVVPEESESDPHCAFVELTD